MFINCISHNPWQTQGGSRGAMMAMTAHLLNVLLEDTELQALVQAEFAVLPDVLQLPLVVQDLVDDVQDVVHCLGVVDRRC